MPLNKAWGHLAQWWKHPPTAAADLAPALSKRERASILIIEQGRILFMHRIKPGKDYYMLPGGSIKPYETAAMACVREAREETGLNVWLGDKLCVLEGKQRLEHVFLAAKHRGQVRLGGPELVKRSTDNYYALEWLDRTQLQQAKLKPTTLLPYCLALLP